MLRLTACSASVHGTRISISYLRFFNVLFLWRNGAPHRNRHGQFDGPRKLFLRNSRRIPSINDGHTVHICSRIGSAERHAFRFRYRDLGMSTLVCVAVPDYFVHHKSTRWFPHRCMPPISNSAYLLKQDPSIRTMYTIMLRDWLQ